MTEFGTPIPCQVIGVGGSLALPEREPQALRGSPPASRGDGSHPPLVAVPVESPGLVGSRQPDETGSRSASARRLIPVANEEARVLKWRPLAMHIARRYFIVGAEQDDVRQEAMLGLLYALREYEGIGEPPTAWAALVIERWVQTRVCHSNRFKHQVLTLARREQAQYVEGDSYLREIPDLGADPAIIVEQREDLRAKLATFAEMSELEKRSIINTINGVPYRYDKQVDNANQRARRKLRAA